MRYMNSAYLHSVGLTKEHIGRNIREIFPKKIADEYLLNNLKVIETGFPIETVEEGHENTGLISIYKIVRFPILFNETVMVGGWAVNITDQIKIQEQLLQNEKIKARHTLKSVITTAESERNYLSVFLRDNVNQVLSSSKLMLEVSSSYTNKFVISAIGHMQEAIDEINTICDQLNPRIVEELGFKEALTTLSIQAKGMVMFHLNLPENDSLNLDSEVQLGVFRIVQNYLTLVKGQYRIFWSDSDRISKSKKGLYNF